MTVKRHRPPASRTASRTASTPGSSPPLSTPLSSLLPGPAWPPSRCSPAASWGGASQKAGGPGLQIRTARAPSASASSCSRRPRCSSLRRPSGLRLADSERRLGLTVRCYASTQSHSRRQVVAPDCSSTCITMGCKFVHEFVVDSPETRSRRRLLHWHVTVDLRGRGSHLKSESALVALPVPASGSMTVTLGRESRD